MGLYRRGKIFWFSIMYEGRRIQSSTKTDNKKLAEVIYAKALTDLIEDRYFDKHKAKTVTFCIMVDRYIQKHQKERDRYSLKHLSPFFGNMTLAEIESEMVDDYIDKRLNEVAHSTVYKEFALGRRMFNVARKRWKWVKDNPFSDVEFPSFDNQRDRWLTVEEEQLLLSVTRQQWLKDIIIFAIHTGCRAGEIISINRNSIDMKRRIVTINSSKGGIKNKVIPMSNILYGMLQKRLRISHISGRIFPVTRDVLKDAFRKVVKRAGIEDLKFYDLRRTFATRLVQAGKDLYVVQKLLGHKTLRMTERYAHHYPESLRPSISALDDCYNFATITNFVTIAIDAKH